MEEKNIGLLHLQTLTDQSTPNAVLYTFIQITFVNGDKKQKASVLSLECVGLAERDLKIKTFLVFTVVKYKVPCCMKIC